MRLHRVFFTFCFFYLIVWVSAYRYGLRQNDWMTATAARTSTMDDAAAITIADARLAMDGLPDPHHPIQPGVVQRSPSEILEVQFSPPDQSEARGIYEGTHSVFVEMFGNFGNCIGGLYLGRSPVQKVVLGGRAEGPIEVALRLFELMFDPRATHLIKKFIPTIVDPPNILAVYYAPVAPEGMDVMGGDITVYLISTGVVVNVVVGS